MKRKNRLLVTLTKHTILPAFFLLLVFNSFAQRTITGTVTGPDKKPVAGASVIVKGTTVGTTTNDQGTFSIVVPANRDILLITYVEYEVNEVTVTGNTVDVTMKEKDITQNEVVVVGYGTQRRTNITGAVSSVNNKTLNEYPVLSVAQALQGRVPGVTVTNNGSPGTDAIVRIRGISSISFASDPLYVVDGFPTGDLASIDTRDIESVDILKDASAAAIYGSRASSGVVMVTTKKGRRDGKLAVNLESFVGFQEVTSRLDLMNREQFMKYAVAYRGSQIPRLSDPQINEPVYPGATTTYGQTDTDWQDAYFRTGFMTQHNLGLSGGNQVSRFYTSAGFTDQEGTGPAVGYRRYNFRINSDHIISKVFTFGQNLYVAHSDQAYDNNETQSRTNIVNVIKMMPHIPVY